MRREGIEKIIVLRENKEKIFSTPLIPPTKKENSTNNKLSILVRNENQLKVALANNIDFIYVCDETLYSKYKTYNNIYLRLNRVLEEHKEYDMIQKS